MVISDLMDRSPSGYFVSFLSLLFHLFSLIAYIPHHQSTNSDLYRSNVCIMRKINTEMMMFIRNGHLNVMRSLDSAFDFINERENKQNSFSKYFMRCKLD